MSQTSSAVFIIDDDESVRRALRRLLRSVGMKAEVYATAEEFLEVAPEPEPGCLILDVNLPGASGLELQERLIAEGRRIPIVFITAYADEPARQRALQAGAIAFLGKPFDEESVLNALAAALQA